MINDYTLYVIFYGGIFLVTLEWVLRECGFLEEEDE